MEMKFILEMANNHKGSVELGKIIITSFDEVVRKRFRQIRFVFKFQRRNLPTLVHPDVYTSCVTKQQPGKYPHITKFADRQLTFVELCELNDYAKKLGFATLCTPFDEASVDDVVDAGFTQIKVASCSANDWPLLNKIAEQNLPVILSTGGLNVSQVDRVVQFFENRQIPLTLMSCVGLYPTLNEDVCVHRRKVIKRTHIHYAVGLSSHAKPTNILEGQLAYADGCRIFEKHVDIDNPHINAYSLTPDRLVNYIEGILQAKQMCHITPLMPQVLVEKDKLRTFARGAYLNRDIPVGEIFGRESLYFAMPIQDDKHVEAADCSKYTYFQSYEPLSKNEPLTKDVAQIDKSKDLLTIAHYVRNKLKANLLDYSQSRVLTEVSHHYGLENFHSYGMCIITMINLEYCKKLLIVLPKQTNPLHYHMVKKETFYVLQGQAEIVVEGTTHCLKKGQMVTIEPNEWHKISSEQGAVIEELSTNHQPGDSYYEDQTINDNKNRKTLIYV